MELLKPTFDLGDVRTKSLNNLIEKINNNEYKITHIKKCPFCSSKDYDIVAERDRFGIPIQAQLCKNCGLIYCNPVIEQDSLPMFYNNEYHTLTFGEKAKQFLFNPNQGMHIYNYLKELIINKDSDEIIIGEVGSGSCDILSYIKSQNDYLKKDIIVYGSEYSDEYVNIAKERYDITVFKGGTEAFIDNDIKVDFLILSHVFEHMLNLNKELDLIKQVLKNDGYLYIEVPGVLNIIHNNPAYDYSYERYRIIAHNYDFSFVTIRNILESNGLKLIKGDEVIRTVSTITEEYNNPIKNDYHRISHYLNHILPSLSEERNLALYYSMVDIDEIRKFENDKKVCDENIKKLQQDLKVRDAKLAKLHQDIEIRDEIIRKKQHGLEVRDDKIDRMQKSIENRDEFIKSLQNIIKSRDETINRIQKELKSKNEKINLIYNSKSWKVGNFQIRLLKKLFGWLPFAKKRSIKG